MVFDPVSWGAGYIASRATNRALGAVSPDDFKKKIEGELKAWAAEVAEQVGDLLPEVMSTFFDGSGDGPRRQQLRAQLERHELPAAASWTAAATERWEEVHALGEDAQSFFRIEPEVARPFLEDLGRRLNTIVASELELLGPAVISRLDALDTAEARKYLREISPAFVEENRQADIRSILGAAVGDWPLVSQDGDFRRQLEPSLLTRLEEAKHPGLLVIVGNAGAGKTTLLRRLGLELLRSGRRVLELRAAGRKSSEWVASVPPVDASGPPVILIDDLFRCEGIEDIVVDADNAFTIVGTSRTNEDQTPLLRFTSSFRPIREGSRWPVLTEPTDDELEELHRRPEFAAMPDAEWRRITFVTRSGATRPAPLLVLLLQLAAGKPYDEIVSNSVAMLKQSPLAWRSYGVICAFHQYGVAVPSEVLTAILGVELRDVLEEQTQGLLRGMVFPTETAEGWITAHELLAESAAELAYGKLIAEHHEAAFRLAQPTAAWWRLLLEFIRALVRAKLRAEAHALTIKHKAVIETMLAADPSRRCDWAKVLASLSKVADMKQAIRECIAAAVPASAAQLAALIDVSSSHGIWAPREELRILEQSVDALFSPVVAERYLKLTTQVGRPEQRDKAIERAIAWSHDPDAHRNVLNAVMAFLGRERRVTDEQRTDAAARLYEWVKGHPQFLTTWQVLLRQLPEPEVLRTAMEHFPDDRNLASLYVRLFEKKLAAEEIEKKYEGLIARLPTDIGLRLEYVSWLDRHGRSARALELCDQVASPAAVNFPGFRYRYAMLLLQAGRIDDAVVQARNMVEADASPLAHSVVGSALARKAADAESIGDIQTAAEAFLEAESAYRTAIRKDRDPGKTGMFESLLGRFYLHFRLWPDAYGAFRAAAKVTPDYASPYIGMACAAAGLLDWGAANAALGRAAKKDLSSLSDDHKQRLEAMLAELEAYRGNISRPLLRAVRKKLSEASIA